MMYEGPDRPPLTTRQFSRRIAMHAALSVGIVLVFLLIGIAGYMFFEPLGWRDAFLNAAMLLGGMGPIYTQFSPAGKLFAGAYALLSGLVFIAVISIMIAPVAHRILHRFHWEDSQ
jgi:hypothetical protein